MFVDGDCLLGLLHVIMTKGIKSIGVRDEDKGS